MKATFVLACLLLACAFVNHNDRRVEAMAEHPPAQVITIPRDPLDPPRCPKVNVMGVPLLNEVAMRADGGPWFHACEYGART